MNHIRHFFVKLIKIIIDIFGFLKFVYRYFTRWWSYGKCYYPFQSTNTKQSIRILATGPSLKNELEELRISGILSSEPLFVMNFFALTDLFIDLKPTRYCLADPCYFKDKVMVDKIKELYRVLNYSVDWSMSLYVPNVSFREARMKITNSNIKIISISTLHYEGFEIFRNFLYKKGVATPSFVNVLMMVEYICLNEGFSELFLYGADHTFLNGLVVGDDNVLYVEDKHFYGSERIVADIHPDGTPLRIAEFIYDKYLTFIEHDILRNYADYLGAEIINCTRCSCIDSYKRISQIKNI